MPQRVFQFFAFLVLTTAVPLFSQDVRGLLPGETLQLTMREPNRIAGTFMRDKVVVRFEAVREDGSVRATLADRQGRELLSATGNAETFAIRYLGGRLNARGRHRREQNTSRAEPKDFDGDVNAAAEFSASAEYRILPFLSRALGANGITGRTHPASLYLHGLGLSAAKRHAITVPLLDGEGATNCMDRRRDPCQDKCFGMCGAECSCWSWVCGDCCGREGCLLHDITCRLCDCDGWRFFAECVLCYSGVSFIGPEPCRLFEGCLPFSCP